MNLIKEHWTKNDICEFYEYQMRFLGSERDQEWEQKIVNTKLRCFGRTSAKAKEIVKDLKKGNYIEFLDNLVIKTHLDSLIYAFLVSSVKDFDTFEKYLSIFADTIDNWASSDTLRFQKKDHDKLFILSLNYLKSKKTFVRRVGLNIFFELIKDDKFVPEVFKVLDGLINEDEYYVNMCAAWLLAECFAKHRDETLKYFEINKTNNFIINKAISKCRDSFRVSKEDKDYLLKFKIKL